MSLYQAGIFFSLGAYFYISRNKLIEDTWFNAITLLFLAFFWPVMLGWIIAEMLDENRKGKTDGR